MFCCNVPDMGLCHEQWVTSRLAQLPRENARQGYKTTKYSEPTMHTNKPNTVKKPTSTFSSFLDIEYSGTQIDPQNPQAGPQDPEINIKKT